MLSEGFAYRYRYTPTLGYDYVSPAVKEVMGYSPDEFYGDSDFDERIIYPEDLPRMAQFVRERASSVVLRFICRDNTVVWMLVNNVAIVDEAGELVAMEGLARVLGRDGGPISAAPEWLTSEKLPPLSEREHEVLGLMARGLTNAQIALVLNISGRTVQHHVGHILNKLSAPNRTAAAAAAYTLGLFGNAGLQMPLSHALDLVSQPDEE
jgi:DNA-binding CsgD family transcriptional regulator